MKFEKFKAEEDFMRQDKSSITADYYFLTRIDSNLVSKELYKKSFTKEYFGKVILNHLITNGYFNLNRVDSDVPNHKYSYEADFISLSYLNQRASDHFSNNTRPYNSGPDEKGTYITGHFVVGSDITFNSNQGIDEILENCFITEFDLKLIPLNQKYDNFIVEYSFQSSYNRDNLSFNCQCKDTTYKGGNISIPEITDKLFLEIMPFGLGSYELFDTTFRRWDRNYEICENPEPHIMVRHLSPELNRFYPTLRAFYLNITPYLNKDSVELWEKYIEIILQPYLNNMEGVIFSKIVGENLEFVLRFYKEDKSYPVSININKPYIINFTGELPQKYSVFEGVDKRFTKPKYNYGLDLNLRKELDLSPMLTYKSNMK